MFKFTIRELLLLTVIGALGVGWGSDSWRNSRKKLALRQGLTCALFQCSIQNDNVEVGVRLPDGELISANSGLVGRQRPKPVMLDCTQFYER
jgi:hypothetical protein